MKNLFLVLVLALTWSGTSLAADGSGGCGPGWNSLSSSSIRSTTNSSSGISSFAMTSGTSNCQRHSIVLKEKEAQHFAETNQQNLEIEMAQGSGEYLAAFARTLGCDLSVTSTFERTMQVRYPEIVTPNVTPIQMLQNVKQQIHRTPDLANRCSNV